MMKLAMKNIKEVKEYTKNGERYEVLVTLYDNRYRDFYGEIPKTVKKFMERSNRTVHDSGKGYVQNIYR